MTAAPPDGSPAAHASGHDTTDTAPSPDAAATDAVNGWVASADAWITDMGERGDWGRRHVLDAPMLALATHGEPSKALDVGCGEGRFCRMMRAAGIETVGIDPVPAMIDTARRRDPSGEYRIAMAEALPAPDAAFDLVVSYLTLIDIDDPAAAIAEMARVLAPGGRLLIANLTGMATANLGRGWIADAEGARCYPVDRYLSETDGWYEWRGIRVRNWHRPLSTYMSLLLGAGLTLTHFAEPAPDAAADPARAERYRRVPWFLVMAWTKPAARD